MNNWSKKKKIIIGTAVLFCLLIVAFYNVTHTTRSVGDSPFTQEQLQEMRKELIDQDLPVSQKEAREKQ